MPSACAQTKTIRHVDYEICLPWFKLPSSCLFSGATGSYTLFRCFVRLGRHACAYVTTGLLPFVLNAYCFYSTAVRYCLSDDDAVDLMVEHRTTVHSEFKLLSGCQISMGCLGVPGRKHCTAMSSYA